MPTQEELRTYVLEWITRACGPQLPFHGAQEVIDGFWERFGTDDGMAICHQAFGVHHGTWRSAPVTAARFAPGQDEFFALPLLAEARG